MYVLLRSDYALISARRYAGVVHVIPRSMVTMEHRATARAAVLIRIAAVIYVEWELPINSAVKKAIKKATIGRKGNP